MPWRKARKAHCSWYGRAKSGWSGAGCAIKKLSCGLGCAAERCLLRWRIWTQSRARRAQEEQTTLGGEIHPGALGTHCLIKRSSLKLILCNVHTQAHTPHGMPSEVGPSHLPGVNSTWPAHCGPTAHAHNNGESQLLCVGSQLYFAILLNPLPQAGQGHLRKCGWLLHASQEANAASSNDFRQIRLPLGFVQCLCCLH